MKVTVTLKSVLGGICVPLLGENVAKRQPLPTVDNAVHVVNSAHSRTAAIIFVGVDIMRKRKCSIFECRVVFSVCCVCVYTTKSELVIHTVLFRVYECAKNWSQRAAVCQRQE